MRCAVTTLIWPASDPLVVNERQVTSFKQGVVSFAAFMRLPAPPTRNEAGARSHGWVLLMDLLVHLLNLRSQEASLATLQAALGITSGVFNISGNNGTIARFGWKAQNKSLLIFAGEAYNVEMGV
jgi:hypothetical protein